MVERVLPRDFPEPPEFIIPLSSSELKELGTFTAIWSQIDQIVLLLISNIARIDMKFLLLMTENLTTGPRVNLLRKLCLAYPSDTNDKLAKLCAGQGGLIEDRNHVIHGLWAIAWNPKAASVAASCMSQKGKRGPIAATKLEELSNRAARFAAALGDLLTEVNANYQGPRPHRVYWNTEEETDIAGMPKPPWPPVRTE